MAVMLDCFLFVVAVTSSSLLYRTSSVDGATTYCTNPPNVENAINFFDKANSGSTTTTNSMGAPKASVRLYKTNDKVEYKCNDDFQLSEPGFVTCKSDGTWSLPTPVCNAFTQDEASCSQMPTIENGICQSDDGSSTATTAEETTEETPADDEQQQDEEDGGEGSDGGDGEVNEAIVRIALGVAATPRRGRRTMKPATTPKFVSFFRDIMSVTLVLRWAAAAVTPVPMTSVKSNNSTRKMATTKAATSRRPVAAVAATTKKTNLAVTTRRASGNKVTQRRNVLQSFQSATCSCLTGYELAGEAAVSCQGQDDWGQLPTCQQSSGGGTAGYSSGSKQSCEFLPFVSGAVCRVMTAASASGTPASIRRHALNGTNEWIDIESRSLTTTPTATRRPSPPMQRLMVTGDSYECKCKPGYTQVSDTMIIECMANGEWSDSPQCKALEVTKYCGVPKEVENADCFKVTDNGTVIGEALKFQILTTRTLNIKSGQRIKFQCKNGFQLQGNPVVSCSTQGMWSVFPTCVSNGCGAAPAGDGLSCVRVVGSGDFYNVGDQAKCSCDFGKRMTGSPVVTCVSVAKWSHTPQCKAAGPIVRVTCPAPPEVAGAGCDCHSDDDVQPVFKDGDTVRYTCNNGFVMNGAPVITCQANSTWTVAPTCTKGGTTLKTPTVSTTTKKPGCLSPERVENAYCPCEDDPNHFTMNQILWFEVGDRVRYTCNAGFQLASGEGLITCQASGSWTDYPKCEPESQEIRRRPG